jgi:hypothetical protein
MEPPIPMDPQSPREWILALMAAVPAAFILIQKLLKGWAADRAGRVGDDAMSGTIEGLAAENARLRGQNTELITTLMEAQKVTIKMASENAKMQVEIDDLRATIERLLRAAGQGA